MSETYYLKNSVTKQANNLRILFGWNTNKKSALRSAPFPLRPQIVPQSLPVGLGAEIFVLFCFVFVCVSTDKESQVICLSSYAVLKIVSFSNSFFTDRVSFNLLVRVEVYSACFRILRICVEKLALLVDINCLSQGCLHDIAKELFHPGNFVFINYCHCKV